MVSSLADYWDRTEDAVGAAAGPRQPCQSPSQVALGGLGGGKERGGVVGRDVKC